MARKFNDGQSNNRKSPSPYNQPPKNNKIQKNTKKDNQPQSNNFQKPQSGPANLNSKPSFPPPPVQNPIQSKPISEAGKTNLAKLASINQLMGVNPATISKPVKNL
jgi:hypothetical protein